jgi:glycerate kinase
MRVLIAPDKFKGTLTADQAARAIQTGWKASRPQDQITLLPITDGGDGFGAVISNLMGAKCHHISTVDAAHRPCRSPWWFDAKAKTAVLEAAATIGLALLPPKKYHPFQLDTFGLGKVIRRAQASGVTKCFVGIGGSATNDGGFGLARALGWRFLDDCGSPIRFWTGLRQLRGVVPPKSRINKFKITVAVDVQNPLLGKKGATRIYGPQKGLRPKDFPLAEACLEQLAAVMEKHFGKALASLPGTGAAGGLGFGLAAFFDAALVPGFELFSQLASLPRQLKRADLLITGEGAMDSSSFMGKGTGELINLAVRARVRCIAIAGKVSAEVRSSEKLLQICALTDSFTKEKANRHAAACLANVATTVARSAD